MAKVTPLENPPPANSPWFAVEKERLARELSASDLSRLAGKGRTHYTQIAYRNGWATTELETVNAFRSALKLPLVYDQGPRPTLAVMDGGVDPLHFVRKRAIETLVREGHDLDEAAKMVDQIRGLDAARVSGEPDPKLVAHFARALLQAKGELGSAPSEDLGLDATPGKPAVKPTKQRKNQR